jgi:hypothetical protein
MQRTRREFLADVGQGMLIAGIGSSLASDLGVSFAFADDAPRRLDFGKLEQLVELMQVNASDKLMPLLVERLNNGTKLNELVSAAALANARTFGGEDYIGFHTFMALAPAYHMSRELPTERQPLPILKVLYRNSNRIQAKGGAKDEVLHPVTAATLEKDHPGCEQLREAVRRKDLGKADQTFAALCQGKAEDSFNELLPTLHDGCEVHRVVLVSRAWEMVNFIGAEQANTLLRQSVHYCVQQEGGTSGRFGSLRSLLPKLLEKHRLLEASKGTRQVDDAWVDRMCMNIFESSAEQAAGAVAEALAEGIEPDAVADAICLAANQLILRDSGRPPNQTAENKPVGSVHGDSIGVHACDSANAWRNIARAANARNCFASLILAAYQVAFDRVERGGEFLKWDPYPRSDARERVTTKDAETLLKQADGAIREKNQELACAYVNRYGELGHDPRPIFDLLLRYAVSEDGALHAEKFYRTTSQEFSTTRKPYRWRQLVALARVTASEYGLRAPGYEQACQLLKV